MFPDMFPRKHELLLGLDAPLPVTGVKYVNGQNSVYLDRLFFLLAEEVKPATKTSYSGVTRLVHDRVGPHRRHRSWNPRFLFAEPRAGVLAHIKLAAAQRNGT